MRSYVYFIQERVFVFFVYSVFSYAMLIESPKWRFIGREWRNVKRLVSNSLSFLVKVSNGPKGKRNRWNDFFCGQKRKEQNADKIKCPEKTLPEPFFSLENYQCVSHKNFPQAFSITNKDFTAILKLRIFCKKKFKKLSQHFFR